MSFIIIEKTYEETCVYSNGNVTPLGDGKILYNQHKAESSAVRISKPTMLQGLFEYTTTEQETSNSSLIRIDETPSKAIYLVTIRTYKKINLPAPQEILAQIRTIGTG